MEKVNEIVLGSCSVPGSQKNLHHAGLELLKAMVLKYYGQDLRQEEHAVSLMEGGKPYLVNHPEIHFNISHSGEKVVCVTGNVPVGVDLQIMRPAAFELLAGKIFSPEEYADYKKHKDFSEEEGIRSFYRYWTKKESYVKFTGTGIRMALDQLDYKGAAFSEQDICSGYALTICVPETWKGKIIKYKGSSV